MLFPTPRYGVEALSTLISRVEGSIMLTPSTPFPVVGDVVAKLRMKTFEIPSADELLTSTGSPYPYTKTFAQHKHEPLICLHTSGTTGFPKPIIWTHDWAASVAEGFYLPSPPGYERLDGMMHRPGLRVMFMFPSFHASGFFGTLFLPLFTGSVCVYPPSAPTPAATMDATADALDLLGEHGNCEIICTGPPHMEYLGANTALLDRVSKKIATAMWSGGDLSEFAGKAISGKMKLFNDMGSTELGPWAVLRKEGAWNDSATEDLWHYMMFHPAMNIRFDPVSESAEGVLYEATMVKNDGEEWGGWVQGMFKIHTQEQEVELGDIFVEHPTMKNMWKHYGRSDDLINFITTEKFHPAAAERRIAAHRGVVDVMMVGTRRPKAALIVRLEDGTSVDEIWEEIENVNNDSPVYARVTKDMLLVVDEPFLKTAKGSIQKHAMLDLYKSKLDTLYAKVDSNVSIA